MASVQGEGEAAASRRWTPKLRWLSWFLLVLGVVLGILGVLDLAEGDVLLGVSRLGLLVAFSLQAWTTLRSATVADAAGLRHRQPLSSRGFELTWDEVADIEVAREPGMPRRVELETVTGERHHLQLVPVEDVGELRDWWRGQSSAPADGSSGFSSHEAGEPPQPPARRRTAT